MEPTDVPRKTEAGEQALKQRTGDLPRQLRTVLILVDGRSDVATLRSKAAGMEGLEEALDELQRRGFIATGKEGRGAAAPEDVAGIKQQLIATAREVLGKDAEKVVKKLEAAPDTREGILEVTRNCKKVVTLIIDEQKAEELTHRCREILGDF